MKSTLDKILISSGCLLLLASVILLLIKQWSLGWELYSFAIVLPAILTLCFIASNFETGTPLDSIWKVEKAAKILFIVLSILLILFQFIAISFAVACIPYYGLSRIPFELLGYFFLVGFIYTLRILYIVTSPSRSTYLRDDTDLSHP
jgi:hypothetical protein